MCHAVLSPLTSSIQRSLEQFTNNAGAHHILDNVGINEIERCFNCIAPGGSISSIGILGGEQKVSPDVPMLAIGKGAFLRYATSFLKGP